MFIKLKNGNYFNIGAVVTACPDGDDGLRVYGAAQNEIGCLQGRDALVVLALLDEQARHNDAKAVENSPVLRDEERAQRVALMEGKP